MTRRFSRDSLTQTRVMDEEIQALFKSGACKFSDHADVLKQCKEMVKSMWAFHKKRKPFGEVACYKSSLCLCGNLQKATGCHDHNKTFAPVVEWVTVHLLFTLGVIKNWKTASIDFTVAFTQASMPEPIFLELPPRCTKANQGQNKPLR